MSDVNRSRAQRLLDEQQLDAVVVSKPESFAWATGAPAGVAAFFRRAGAAMALIPAAAAEPLAAVCTELFAAPTRAALGSAHVHTHADWVETADIRPWLETDLGAAALTELAFSKAGRPTGFERPAAFDARQSFLALGELLQARGLSRARIGLDLDFWPVADFELLKAVLPSVQWRDASRVLGQIKAVKSPAEIARLTQAALIAEAGIHHALAAVHEGIHRDAIAAAWREGVAMQTQRLGATLSAQWEYTTVGPLPWTGGGHLQRGDVLKFDVGCVVQGYSSDSGRSYTLGPARPRTREIMAALNEAFSAGLAVLKPGHLMREVHAAATRAMQRAGFSRFSRGHFGHSLGHDTFCEVPPFLSAQADEPLEAGMVLAFETPFYVDGEGGFIIEDQFLITEQGAQAAWSLPRELVCLPL
jgi:Xaa-Pro aminopeptidase